MNATAHAPRLRAAAHAPSGHRISAAAAAADCVFLGLVVAISLALYVRRLGFYYDDYSVLARLEASADRSLPGLYDAVRPATGQRPLQAAAFAVLYRLFGLHPLGYHLANAGLIVAVAALLYLALRELRLPRLVCVGVPLVYSTLPHYATDRFWVDAIQINLSSAFYLLSLFTGLRAIHAPVATRWAWLAVAVVGVAGSMFSYEVVFPLFALNLGLMWWSARRSPSRAGRGRGVAITVGTAAVAMLAVGAVKTFVVAQQGQNGYRIGFEGGLLHHLASVVWGAARLDVGTYLLAFPYVLWWIVRHQFAIGNAAVAILGGSAALLYMWRIGRGEWDVLVASRTWRALVGIGAVAVVLGYAIFASTGNVLFRSAGIDNRVNAGAALGLAGIVVGAGGWLSSRLEPRRQLAAFSAIIACSVAAGTFVIGTLASSWTSAARQQRAIVTGIVTATGPSRGWSTVVLDGACPEQGPAVVFADQWDLRGALQLHFHDPSLVADAAAEAMRATPRGLALDMTFLSDVSTRVYPYGRGLAIYDSKRRRLYRLPDRSRAARYLARSRPAFRCPPQRSFAWGFDPERWWSLL